MSKTQQPNKLALSDQFEKTLRGLVGTPKAEVDAEERKQRQGKRQKRSSTRRKQSR